MHEPGQNCHVRVALGTPAAADADQSGDRLGLTSLPQTGEPAQLLLSGYVGEYAAQSKVFSSSECGVFSFWETERFTDLA